jgi:hypothetical protein
MYYPLNTLTVKKIVGKKTTFGFHESVSVYNKAINTKHIPKVDITTEIFKTCYYCFEYMDSGHMTVT